jgi:ABC-2 type transport system ATP-binding protein
MPTTVSVRDLRKRYGSVEAVRGVSFEVRQGEVFGLLGPNGAGKTSTLECLVGLRRSDAGVIEVCGLDARRSPDEVKQRIGVALQSTSLQDKITPREAIRLFASFYRSAVAPADLLRRFALEARADVAFDTLSGGERQRLALALAFVNRPELVVLDEPTTGLDPASRRDLHDEIRRMKAEGCTVLLSTHYLEEAEALCDRIAIIDAGRVVATGTPAELTAAVETRHAVTLVTREEAPADFLDGLAGVEQLVREGARLRFQTPTPERILVELAARLDRAQLGLIDLRIQRASLEDVFLRLTHPADETEAGR